MHSTTSLFVGVIIQNFNDLKAEKDKGRAGGLCVDKQMVNRLCMARRLGGSEAGRRAQRFALLWSVVSYASLLRPLAAFGADERMCNVR